MGRRRVTSSVNCAKPGCGEYAHFEYDSMRERAEGDRRRLEHPWRCYRHSAEDEVLSADNPARETALTVTRLRNPSYERQMEEYRRTVAKGYPINRYAREPEEFYDRLTWEGANNGIVSGPGFRALAEDFPVGTRLIVSVRVELPGGVA